MKFLKTILILLTICVLSAYSNLTVSLLIDSISEGQSFGLIMNFAVWLLSMVTTVAGLFWLLLTKTGMISNKGSAMIRDLVNRLDAFNELWVLHPNGQVELKNAFIRDEAVELSTPGAGKHPDDIAVDMFAAAMKAKLAMKREQGLSGWETLELSQLTFLLHRQVNKEELDPIDVANYAAFLWNRI